MRLFAAGNVAGAQLTASKELSNEIAASHLVAIGIAEV